MKPFLEFLGAFVISRKATLTFVMSVYPSVPAHGTTRLPLDGFHEILYLSTFRKSVEKIQVSLKCDENNWYFARRPMCIYENIC